MKCPDCGLVNPPSALRCDCGYNFESKVVEIDKESPTAGDSFLLLPEGKYRNASLWFFLFGFLGGFYNLLLGDLRGFINNSLINPLFWIACVLFGLYRYNLRQEEQSQPQGIEEQRVRDRAPGFVGFLSAFFSKYSEFLKTYVVMRKPPFLLVTIWLLGMASVIDRLEVRFLRTGEYQIDNWIAVWTLTVVVGLLAGYLAYWILGSWYHLRVWLSGGSGEMSLSRNLFLYTGIPLYLVVIFAQITDTLVYRNEYFINPTFLFLDLTWFVLAVTAIVYSISLSYKGVRLLHSSATFRSIMFFIVLPAIFYVVVFGWVAFTAFEMFDEGLSYNEQALEELTAGNYDEAERLLDLALEKMTKDDQEETRIIHENLGLLYLNKGDDDQALKHYQEALSLSDFNGPEYYNNTGEIKLLEGNVTAAIEDFERVLEIEPDHFGANNNLGLIFLGMIDEEIVDYERALPHNQKAYSLSGNVITIENLALSYYALDRYSDALPLFETLNSFSPDNASAKYYIGLIYWENGDLTRAAIFLKEAIQLDPSLYSEEIGELLGIPSGEQPSGGVI